MSDKHLVRYSKANPEDFEFESFHWVSKSTPAKVNKLYLLVVKNTNLIPGSKTNL